jgi:hypothetical protein
MTDEQRDELITLAKRGLAEIAEMESEDDPTRDEWDTDDD